MTTSATDAARADAATVHGRAIIVDGHCDTPYRLRRSGGTLASHDDAAQLDLEKLKQSGITASFFVSYVPPFYAGRGAARFARELIAIIHREAAAHPDQLTFATSAAEIRQAKRDGKIALMIGVEGGHAIEDSLEILEEFYASGARYMTLTHVNTNNWADSSGDAERHGGLTDFGRDVVRRMNQLGMIVDISHVSDKTFYHALETSTVPLVATHSSCRALTSHPRNLTDQMLRDLASAGGLCMINFFSAFINQSVTDTMRKATRRPKSNDAPSVNEEIPDDRFDWDDYQRWFDSLGCPNATLDDAVDHIMHAVEVAGVDHVGIGSDFDGVPALPDGLTDASKLPAVTAALLERALSAEEVEKVLGLNFLRVFEQIERGASR
jgi:membrane dipeptidase